MTDTGPLGSQRGEQTRNKRLKVNSAQDDEAFRWLMADARGRRWVWRVLTDGGVFRSSMTGEPVWTAFNEGRRDAALGVMADVMRLTPTLYVTMQAEATARQTPETKTDG